MQSGVVLFGTMVMVPVTGLARAFSLFYIF
jgi:hypothetical protein